MQTLISTAAEGGNYYGSVTASVPLPFEAAEKLRDLRQQAADAHAVVRAATDALREQQALLNHARFEKERAERPPYALQERQIPVPPGSKAESARILDPAPIRIIGQRYQRAQEAVERAQQVVNERSARWNTIAQLVARIDEWLRRVPDEVDIVQFPPAKLPTLKKGDRPAEVVARVRADVSRLTADLRRVQSAPLPSSVAKIRAREQVSELVERGKVDSFGLVESGAPLLFPKTWTYLPDGKPHAEIDAIGLLAWIDPDRLIARIEAEIDRVADDKNAMAPETRQSEEGRLKSEILSIERLEESAIMVAAADGVEILRRPNADPRAVLGLADHIGTDA